MTIYTELGIIALILVWILAGLMFLVLFGWSEARRKRRRARQG